MALALQVYTMQGLRTMFFKMDKVRISHLANLGEHSSRSPAPRGQIFLQKNLADFDEAHAPVIWARRGEKECSGVGINV